MPARGRGEVFAIIGIGGDDSIAVFREQDERRVDHVASMSGAQ